MATHPLYRTYTRMIDRCTNAKHVAFRLYGGRGIGVCAEWRGHEGFDRWLAHIGPKPTPQHQMDRIDNDRGYEPGNVRWATRSENQRNRGDSIVLEIDGVREHVIAAAERYGLSPQVVTQRLQKGWTVKRSLTTPVKPAERRIEFNGQTHSLAEWADKLGIDRVTLQNRLDLLGWTVERALTCPVRSLVRSGKTRQPSKPLTLNGVTKTGAQWARELGLTEPAIRARIRSGWSVERALTTPPGPSGPKKSSPR